MKFVRPINIVDTKSASLQDATTGTAKIDMSELFGLTDWRGKDFAVKPVNFYTYYEKIVDKRIDITNWPEIDKLVVYLQSNSSAKVKVTGYVDVNTGNSAAFFYSGRKPCKYLYC